MPKFTMSQLRNKLKQIASEQGTYLNNDYAKKLAARYLLEEQVGQDLESNGLQHDPLTYKDETGEKAVRAWFTALINQKAQVAA